MKGSLAGYSKRVPKKAQGHLYERVLEEVAVDKKRLTRMPAS
jgi:hypothetical protein